MKRPWEARTLEVEWLKKIARVDIFSAILIRFANFQFLVHIINSLLTKVDDFGVFVWRIYGRRFFLGL